LIELGDDLGANTIELFLGEGTEEGPGEIEGLEDGSGFVGTWRKKENELIFKVTLGRGER